MARGRGDLYRDLGRRERDYLELRKIVGRIRLFEASLQATPGRGEVEGINWTCLPKASLQVPPGQPEVGLQVPTGTVMPELNLLRFLPLLLFQVHKVTDLDLVLELKKRADLDRQIVGLDLQ